MNNSFNIEIFKSCNTGHTNYCLVNEYEVQPMEVRPTLDRLMGELSMADLIDGIEIVIELGPNKKFKA